MIVIKNSKIETINKINRKLHNKNNKKISNQFKSSNEVVIYT